MIKKYITTKNIVIAVTFCLILASGILTKQNPLFMVPLFVSLGVMALQADVNRTAYLIGGINAGIYGIVYIYMGLYASAASALLFSCPLQLVTFINWKRKAYGKATVFKKLTAKARIGLALVAVLGFGVLYFSVSTYIVVIESVLNLNRNHDGHRVNTFSNLSTCMINNLTVCKISKIKLR